MVEALITSQGCGSAMDTNSDNPLQQDLGSMEVDRERMESNSEPVPRRSYMQSLQGDLSTGKPATQLNVQDGDFESLMDELGPKLKVSEHIESQIDKALEFAVVAKLLGRSLGYNVLCQRIKSLWSLADGFQVLDMQEGYFFIKLSSQEELNRALLDGPWTIMGHCLLVQKWEREFRASSSTIGKTAMWIRLLDLPIQYYHERVLWEVGNLLGRTLKIDQHTRDLQRAKFARIAIEFDFANPLIPKFRINEHWIRVEYEGLPLVCFGCGRIGHNQQCCPFLADTRSKTAASGPEAGIQQLGNQGNRSEVGIPAGANTSPLSEDSEFGPWIHAQRRGRRTLANGSHRNDQLAGTNSVNLGTRFDMLREESEEQGPAGEPLKEKIVQSRESNQRDESRNLVMSGTFSKLQKAKEKIGNGGSTVFGTGKGLAHQSKDKVGPSFKTPSNFTSPGEKRPVNKPTKGMTSSGPGE